MKRLAALAAAAAAVLLAPPALAESVPFVGTDELKRMMDAKADFVLADALSPIEFAEEHIAGAVNISPAAVRSGKSLLPADKAKKVVFYCKGPKCTRSTRAAGLAVKAGHTNVAVYNEGLPEWVKRGYPVESRKIYPVVDAPIIAPADLKRMVETDKRVFLLDIREEEDVRAGWIAGSKNVDIESLDGRLADVPKDRRIVIVDLHGKQANVAARYLAYKGYKDVARLDGGFVGGWLKAGLPFER